MQPSNRATRRHSHISLSSRVAMKGNFEKLSNNSVGSLRSLLTPNLTKVTSKHGEITFIIDFKKLDQKDSARSSQSVWKKTKNSISSSYIQRNLSFLHAFFTDNVVRVDENESIFWIHNIIKNVVSILINRVGNACT